MPTDTERHAEIHQLVLDNYPPAKEWEPDYVPNWCAWAAEHGFLFLCYDKPGDEGKLLGLCIARPLSFERRAALDYNGSVTETDFDEDGEVVYVDLLVSKAGKQVLKAIMPAIQKRMGHRAIILFKRLKTQSKFNIYRFADFAKKLTTGRR